MPKYLLRRFAEMLITLFLIATATFFLLEAVPGDPLTERASKLSPTVKENLYKRYGLDKPMMERYVITMKGICKGEFGESVVYAGQTVQKLFMTVFRYPPALVSSRCWSVSRSVCCLEFLRQ